MPTPHRRWWLLGFAVTGYLLVFAAVTMMNVALPAAQEDLGLSTSARQGVITLYSLTFGGLMLLGGRVADAVGLRRGAIAGLTGFALAALIGGLAPTTAVLLTARVLQGATGALAVAATLALLSTTFASGPDRAKAFAVLGTVMGAGTAGSFVLAGWLTDAASWRWSMLVATPIAAVAAVGVAVTAQADRPKTGVRFDVLGALLVTSALSLTVAGFDRAAHAGWLAPVTVASLTAAVLLLAGFIVSMRRTADPLLPPALLADRTRASGCLAAFTLAIGVFGGFYLVTGFLHDELGYSAMRTGVAFVPFGITAMAVAKVWSRLADRVAPTVFLTGGLASIALAIGLLARLDDASRFAPDVLPTLLLLGVGASAVMVTATELITAGSGPHSGVAGSTVNAAQQVGAAVGTALLGATAAADGPARAGLLGGIVVAVGAIAALGLAGRTSRPTQPPTPHEIPVDGVAGAHTMARVGTPGSPRR